MGLVDKLDARVKTLENGFKDLQTSCKDISDRLIRMEETLKNNKYTSVDFKTYNVAFMEMSSSIRLLTDKVGEVLIKLDKQDERIAVIESRDGDKAKKALTWLATTVGALILGAVVGTLMKGGV